MKCLITFFFAAVLACNSAIASPGGWKKVDLGGKWAFKPDPHNLGEEQEWRLGQWATENCDSIDVPGNWDLQNEYADYAGKAWYARTFVADAEWKIAHIRLVFESVYNEARVWLNGVELGGNKLGFLPFHFDLLDGLSYDEENVLVVLVDNTFKRGAMWNWGGIRRPVWLEITDRTRLEYQHITALPDLEKGGASIHVDFGWSSFGGDVAELSYRIDLLSENKVVKSVVAPVPTGTPNAPVSVAIELPASDVELWHFDNPVLYTSQLSLIRGEEIIHKLTDRFGIRKVETMGTNLLLNGECVRTVGFNLVPEDRTTGSTLPTWRIMEDVDLMKSLGANMARLSHQNLPKEFLDYLDEKGIMVFEEVALWGKDEWVDPAHPMPKEWLQRMVHEKYNHPSIIGWCVGNEIGYFSMNPLVMEYVEGAIRHAKQLDPYRLAVCVSHTAHLQERDLSEFSDIVMLNRYSNWGEDAAKAHAYHPDKPLFMAEYGHRITDEDLDKGVIAADSMLAGLKGKSYVVGASYWTFNDYRSAYSGTPPSGNRSWGVVNVFRQKKRAFEQFRAQYAPVKSFEWSSAEQIVIQPRDMNEFPSYSLNGYSVAWQAYDKTGGRMGGGFEKLPTIKPGDSEFSIHPSWKINLNGASKLTAALVSPLGYTVAEQTLFLTKPPMPEIVDVLADNRSIRVVYKQAPMATHWKLIYSDGATWKETAPSINGFIEVDGLVANRKYQIGLVAINGFGESEPQWVDSVSTKPNELPPVILYTQSAENGWYIGYSATTKDYLYQVRYRREGEDYQDSAIRQFSMPGVGKVEFVPPGKYRFQMRRLLEWGFASEWSPEVSITTGESNPNKRVVSSTLLADRKGNNLLALDPVDKAIGYVITFQNRATGKITSQRINAARINYMPLNDIRTEDFDIEVTAVLKSENRDN